MRLKLKAALCSGASSIVGNLDQSYWWLLEYTCFGKGSAVEFFMMVIITITVVMMTARFC
jgi:hypothetical protein